MKAEVEQIDTKVVDVAVTSNVADNNKDDLEPTVPFTTEISKTAAWARAHKGFIEILDPELRSQLSYFRKRNQQAEQSARQEEVAI